MTRDICRPAARAIIICAIGASRPPLMPCKARNPISEPADQASPHNIDDSVKPEKHQR